MGQLLVMLIFPPIVGVVTYIIIRRLWEREEIGASEAVARYRQSNLGATSRMGICMRQAIRCALIAAVLATSTLFTINPSTAQISNSCHKFVGLWSWNGGSGTKIDIKPDGTADVLCALCAKICVGPAVAMYSS